MAKINRKCLKINVVLGGKREKIFKTHYELCKF